MILMERVYYKGWEICFLLSFVSILTSLLYISIERVALLCSKVNAFAYTLNCTSYLLTHLYMLSFISSLYNFNLAFFSLVCPHLKGQCSHLLKFPFLDTELLYRIVYTHCLFFPQLSLLLFNPPHFSFCHCDSTK